MAKEITKIYGVIILSLILVSLISNFVLGADATDVAVNAQVAGAGIRGFFTGLLEPLIAPAFGDKEMLTRVFFAFLLFLIIYTISDMIFGKKSKLMVFLISGVITALSLIAMPSGFLVAVRSTYGAMGATILSVIPFMIILVFTVRVQSALVARIIWIFFMCYYFGLLIYNMVVNSKGFTDAENIPYIATIIAGGFIFFFIGVIRKAIFKGEMEAVREQGSKVATRGNILHRLQKKELEESYTNIGNN